MTPRLACLGATSSTIGESGLRRKRTMGRWRDSRAGTLSRIDKTMLFNGRQVGHHQGKGFIHAQFTAAQLEPQIPVLVASHAR